ncbi:RhoGEF domain protein [Rhizoctonia solani 123E]|uniref:RhoGEF domain protein n=1 Tax=Rhizoctonia solani 123E TaxID=1423351 RepID=A0A074SVC8_9AGAM|nr:RhoGEF domain protein [Rhizoctonia solani 123E]
MGFLTRPDGVMQFPRGAASDAELRSEWSSSEDGRSFKTVKGTKRVRKPRWTVETDRPRRSQSERVRRTMESDRPGENDRPSVDQKRFQSLLRVPRRTRVISAPSEPESDVLEPRKGKRGSWLDGLRFTRSPSASRAPTPSSAPCLAPIPSNSPLGPMFQLSPATPGGKSIFGTGGDEGEDVCSAQGPDEPWSRVTDHAAVGDYSEHEPRMLSRASSARSAPPQRPVPSHPVPAVPVLPDDRHRREATIRPNRRPLSASEIGMNGDKTSFLDGLDVSDEEVYYGEDIPPGTATTVDEPRIAGTHRSQLSMSSRVPITETNIRWSAAGRSRSNSAASASQWRGASVYVEDDQSDEDVYGLPSPNPTFQDAAISNGTYGGIVGPRRDLYSDDELESVLEETESDCDHDREDRTAAMIIADEGRGLIVDAEARPLSQLDVQTGTTHLLLGSSPSSSSVSGFLAQVLPQISTTLLCLDISNNELTALPAALSACTHLEELNVSHNPLRSLPSSLGALVSLRVFIADACDIQALPSQLVNLGALHSLSVRANRLVMLPVWMCAMPSLEVLKIEGNTFAGPWRNLVEPLLPRDTSSPPPNTVYTAARAANSLPLLSTNGSLASPIVLGRPESQRSYSQQPSSAVDPRWSASGTSPISFYPTSNSAPHSPPRHAFSPPPHVTMSPPPATGLAHLQFPIQSPPSTAAKLNMHLGALAPTPRRKKKRAGGGSISGSEIMTTDAESEVEATTSWASAPRRMKSADELRRFGDDQAPPPSAPILTTAPTLPEPPQGVKRYMSLGVRSSPSRPDSRQMWAGGSARNSTVGAGSRNSTGPRGSRYSATGLQGQKVEEDEVSPDASFEFGADEEPPSIARAASDERVGQRYSGVEDAYAQAKTAGTSPEEQRRKGRWGFLKKVSMGRLRSHSNAERLGRLPAAQTGNAPAMPSLPQPIPHPAPPRVDVTSAASPASSVLTARVLHDNINGAGLLPVPSSAPPRAKRRSFLPFDTPPTLNIPITSGEPFMPNVVALGEEPEEEMAAASEEAQRRADEEIARQQMALRGIMSYLRDMADLEGGMSGVVASRRPPLTQYMDGRTKSDGSYASSTSTPPMLRSAPSTASLRGGQDSVNTTDSSGSYGQFAEDRKYKDDKGRRVAIVREIIETEKSYVKGLQELVDIYVRPASEPAPGLNVNKETTIPSAERKIVFTGVDALLQFHKQSFLPSLAGAAEILSSAAPGEDVSTRAAHSVANVFVSHAAFMKMYFTYINNFDNAIQRLQFWSAPPSAPNTPGTATPASNTPSTVGVGLSMVAMGVAGVAPDQPHTATLNAGQRKRIKQFLKRCRLHPRHSQLNLEGYLLLPIQRIPRYKMLLDNLVTCTPPHPETRDDPLERALEEIAVLASSMNEGKRESESRTKLVQWQSRIKGKFISPLVQPHRRLIMDGRLQLVRLVKKVNSRADVPNPDGSLGQVEVPCLSSDANPKQLVAILCNDLLVLCKDVPGAEQVELWAVLRMQTMAQPASIVSGNGLRIVDNKAILYFNTQSTSEALTWQRAINLHIPHSQ